MDKKAEAIFRVMINRGLIPANGQFDITDELRDASYDIFRELFSPDPSYRMKNSDVKFAKRMAGLNMLKLNESRSNQTIKIKNKVTHKSGFVYIISNPAFPGKYKIGMTKDVNNRLSQYQTYDPHRQFKIEHYIFVEDKRAVEKRILDLYQIDIDKGEWISEEKAKVFFTDKM